MTWHPVAPPCEYCGEFCDTTIVSFRSDGLIAVGGYCQKCKESSCVTFTPEEVFKKCREMDSDPSSTHFDLSQWETKGKAN